MRKRVLFCLSITVPQTLLPLRFERFVDKVEKNADSFTKEEWQSASDQFDKLMADYEKSYDKLSDQDKERIDKAIGRYHALVVKSGINSVIESFNEAVSDLSSTIKGIVKGIGSFFEELGKGDGGEE